MSTLWQKHFSQPESDQTLPVALAILLPNLSPAEINQQLSLITSQLPFISSVWMGQTSGFIDDFSLARNSVLDQITEPWVFWLDSDESLADPNLVFDQLKTALADSTSLGFYLSRLDWFHQTQLKFGEAGSLKLLRIHRTDQGRFVNKVHEVFSPANQTQIKTIPIKIYHHCHRSISEFLTKVSRYALIRAEERLTSTNRVTQLQLVWELIWWPIGKFGYNFVWKKGFKDGYRGLIYALMMSIHSALVRIFALEKLIQNRNSVPYES